AMGCSGRHPLMSGKKLSKQTGPALSDTLASVPKICRKYLHRSICQNRRLLIQVALRAWASCLLYVQSRLPAQLDRLLRASQAVGYCEEKCDQANPVGGHAGDEGLHEPLCCRLTRI